MHIFVDICIGCSACIHSATHFLPKTYFKTTEHAASTPEIVCLSVTMYGFFPRFPHSSSSPPPPTSPHCCMGSIQKATDRARNGGGKDTRKTTDAASQEKEQRETDNNNRYRPRGVSRRTKEPYFHQPKAKTHCCSTR